MTALLEYLDLNKEFWRGGQEPLLTSPLWETLKSVWEKGYALYKDRDTLIEQSDMMYTVV